MKTLLILLIFSTGALVHANESNFNVSKAEYAVFQTVDKAKQSIESQIWKEAFETCEGQPIPILLTPIQYKIIGSGGSLEVIGWAKFNCGF